MTQLIRSARAAVGQPPLVWILLLALRGGCGGEEPDRGDDSVVPTHYERMLTGALVHDNVRLEEGTVIDVDWYEPPGETWGEACLSNDVFVTILLIEYTTAEGCTTVRDIVLDDDRSFSFDKPTDAGPITIDVTVASDMSSLVVQIPFIADDLVLPRTEDALDTDLGVEE